MKEEINKKSTIQKTKTVDVETKKVISILIDILN